MSVASTAAGLPPTAASSPSATSSQIAASPRATTASEGAPAQSWSAPASYRELLRPHANNDEGAKFVLDFLEEAPKVKSPESTKLFVFDSQGGRLQRLNIAPHEVGSCPPETKTRIIMLHYKSVPSADRRMIEALAFSLSLPPFVIWSHLSSRMDKRMPASLSFGLRSPFDDFPTLEIGGLYGKISTISSVLLRPKREGEAQIWLILLRGEWLFRPLPSGEPTVQYDPTAQHRSIKVWDKPRLINIIDTMLRLSDEECACANENPHEYLRPIILYEVDQLAADLDECLTHFDRSRRTKNANVVAIRDLIDQININLEGLEELQAEVCSHIEACHYKPSANIAMVLKDISALLGRASRARNLVRDQLSVQVSLASLEESRKSIEQAQSAKRISQLAYIYLPLAFGSSLFGMNIPQFENASLTSYVVTSVVLLAISVALWFLFSPLQRLIRWYTVEPRVMDTLGSIFWRYPLCWSILYAHLVLHGSRRTFILMEDIGLVRLMRVQKNPRAPLNDEPVTFQATAAFIAGTRIRPRLLWTIALGHVFRALHRSDKEEVVILEEQPARPRTAPDFA